MEFDGARLADVIYRRLIINKKSPRPLTGIGEKRGGECSEFRARRTPERKRGRDDEAEEGERKWKRVVCIERAAARRPDLILISDAFSA